MRMRGHGEHDDCSYVPPKLLEEYAKRDPIMLASERLLSEGVVTAKELDTLDEECQEEIDQAYHQALDEPVPHPESLMENVYAEG